MNPVLLEVSELLRRFAGADWRDLYVRTAHYTLFIAKAGGAPNPMLDAAAKSATAAVAEQGAEYTIAAPHVGTVASIAQVGEEIEYGSSVIRLALLGETVEVRSEHAGVVTDVLAQPGDLVQYDTSLLRIARRASTGSHGAPDQ
jgi:acetyl-CoA carboxylase biotin carboxyl carrier protein